MPSKSLSKRSTRKSSSPSSTATSPGGNPSLPILTRGGNAAQSALDSSTVASSTTGSHSAGMPNCNSHHQGLPSAHVPPSSQASIELNSNEGNGVLSYTECATPPPLLRPQLAVQPPMAAEVEVAVTFLTHLVKKRLGQSLQKTTTKSIGAKLSSNTSAGSTSGGSAATDTRSSSIPPISLVAPDGNTRTSSNSGSQDTAQVAEGTRHSMRIRSSISEGSLGSPSSLASTGLQSSVGSTSWPTVAAITDEGLERFGRELTNVLYEQYSEHWFPTQPWRGSAFRSLSINGNLDLCIVRGAQLAAVDGRVLRSCLPAELTVWIDPGQVSYRIGEDGSVCDLFKGEIVIPPASVSPPPTSPTVRKRQPVMVMPHGQQYLDQQQHLDGQGQQQLLHHQPHSEAYHDQCSYGGSLPITSCNSYYGSPTGCSVTPPRESGMSGMQLVHSQSQQQMWYPGSRNVGNYHNQQQQQAPHVSSPSYSFPGLSTSYHGGETAYCQGSSNIYHQTATVRNVELSQCGYRGDAASVPGFQTLAAASQLQRQQSEPMSSICSSTTSSSSSNGLYDSSHYENVDDALASMDLNSWDHFFCKDNLERMVEVMSLPAISAYGSA